MSELSALILANGDLGDAEAVSSRIAGFAADLVIAADGGSRLAAALGVTPTVIVGDLDSAKVPTVDGPPVERHPIEKDETDLELALRFAVREGARSIAIVGATGGRIDMTVANVLLLLLPALEGRRVELWSDRQTAFVIRPPGGDLPGGLGDVVSLLPLGGPAYEITTRGLAFPLRSETLYVGPARGVSNRIETLPAGVQIGSGTLLVVHSPAPVVQEA